MAESDPDESDIRRFWQSPIKTRPTEDEVDVDSMTVRSPLGCEGTKKREKSLDYDYQFVNSIPISIFNMMFLMFRPAPVEVAFEDLGFSG